MPAFPSSNPAQFIQGAPVLHVPDVQAAVGYYRDVLGFISDFGDDEYAVVWRDNSAIHFVKGERAPSGVHLLQWVRDVDVCFRECRARGAEITTVPADRPYALRDFSIRDPNGVAVVFVQDIEMRNTSQSSTESTAMPIPPAPVVECDVHHTGIMVPDVLAAVDFYTGKLGFTLAFTWGSPVTMAGVSLDKAQIFLEAGTPNPAGCNLYFVVDDSDALHAYQKANGVTVVDPPEDRHYGLRDFHVTDLNGYHLSFGHHIFTTGAPLPIERVELSVRLERRLAALLEDLARHKRMSVGSCLEEILLHTNEGVGPHTKSQLRYIARLKVKHGIDYDSHASYRFTEAGPAGARERDDPDQPQS